MSGSEERREGLIFLALGHHDVPCRKDMPMALISADKTGA